MRWIKSCKSTNCRIWKCLQRKNISPISFQLCLYLCTLSLPMITISSFLPTWHQLMSDILPDSVFPNVWHTCKNHEILQSTNSKQTTNKPKQMLQVSQMKAKASIAKICKVTVQLFPLISSISIFPDKFHS